MEVVVDEPVDEDVEVVEVAEDVEVVEVSEDVEDVEDVEVTEEDVEEEVVEDVVDAVSVEVGVMLMVILQSRVPTHRPRSDADLLLDPAVYFMDSADMAESTIEEACPIREVKV